MVLVKVLISFGDTLLINQYYKLSIQIFNYHPSKKTASIGLKVKANAKINKIGRVLTINGQKYLKLSIKEAAENGRANEEMIDFLFKEWKIPKKDLEIIRGATSHLKILSIRNIELDYLIRILKA